MSDSAAPPDFLNVSRSATGRTWRARLDGPAREQALAITQLHGIPDIVARVLAGRGVLPDEAPRYLDPRLRDLMVDPSTLTDMDEVAARLAAAARRGEKVVIFGDYDVDGACSAALLAEWLSAFGIAARIHIPDRIVEGYGPNAEAIRALRSDGATLLVCVDCGTTSDGALAVAAEVGLETLVLDHHQAPEKLPTARGIVNPNRHDDLSGQGHLCAAGVVFMTLVAANRVLRAQGASVPDLINALDLVALATVADVVPLKGLNRAFVRQGLAVMRRRTRPGLAALMDAARLDGAPTPFHLGFLIGPRINAGGRIGDAALGARLLTTADPIEAQRIAGELDRLNRERQVIEQTAVEDADAMAQLILRDEPEAPVLLVASPEWHPGIVGLVASRLKERYRRPAFAFAVSGEGLATGSGRSVAGVDLGRAVRAAVDAGIAVKGGGHAMAAGATVAAGKLDFLRSTLGTALGVDVARARADVSLLIDATLTARGASAELAESIEAAGPFGAGAPEPVFALAQHLLIDVAEVGSAGHLRCRFKSADGAVLSGVAFRAAAQPLGAALREARGRPVHAAGSLVVDRWGGGAKVDFRIVDVAAVLPG